MTHGKTLIGWVPVVRPTTRIISASDIRLHVFHLEDSISTRRPEHLTELFCHFGSRVGFVFQAVASLHHKERLHIRLRHMDDEKVNLIALFHVVVLFQPTRVNNCCLDDSTSAYPHDATFSQGSIR